LCLWDQGYYSTDCNEDNDSNEATDSDEEYSDDFYYDEEDEEEEEEDLEAKIKTEMETKNMTPEEKKFMESQSDLEKEILKKEEAKPAKK
jgi:hypothetical protein